MLTRDLEAEVREPAWATKVRLGPQELTGAPGRDVAWPLLGALVFLGLTGGLGNDRSALYATSRRVCDLVAIR
jgi:hypothetical protein